ncbi:MAG TPA: hypothetical protein VM487_10175, partial [Phycisphaerae bacterium]|nr:hypothetical protein [Phycisphaerae bacterium]
MNEAKPVPIVGSMRWHQERITELETALEHSQAGVNEIRDDCELRMRIRAERIAELEATLKRKGAEIVARGEYVEWLQAQLAEAQECLHLANGVAQLAMKHRDDAEALLAEYRGAPSVWLSPDA